MIKRLPVKSTVKKIVNQPRDRFDSFVDGDPNGVGESQSSLFPAEVFRLATDEEHPPPRSAHHPGHAQDLERIERMGIE